MQFLSDETFRRKTSGRQFFWATGRLGEGIGRLRDTSSTRLLKRASYLIVLCNMFTCCVFIVNGLWSPPVILTGG